MKKTRKKNPPAEIKLPPPVVFDYELEINRRAYELWEAAGGGHGDDLRHWLVAEREFQARRQSDKAQ